jgi:serine protease inhibitor ecotin
VEAVANTASKQEQLSKVIPFPVKSEKGFKTGLEKST